MALYCDIDGTLSRIAPTPDSARIEPGAPEALRRISGFGIRVVAISGRSSEDARNLVGLHEIDYAGNHGFELLTRDGRLVSEEVRQASLLVQQALGEIEALGVQLPPGVLIENKVYTGSIHYRTDGRSRSGPPDSTAAPDRDCGTPWIASDQRSYGLRTAAPAGHQQGRLCRQRRASPRNHDGRISGRRSNRCRWFYCCALSRR